MLRWPGIIFCHFFVDLCSYSGSEKTGSFLPWSIASMCIFSLDFWDPEWYKKDHWKFHFQEGSTRVKITDWTLNPDWTFHIFSFFYSVSAVWISLAINLAFLPLTLEHLFWGDLLPERPISLWNKQITCDLVFPPKLPHL